MPGDSPAQHSMKLFKQVQIGTLQLRNRIVMPPMATLFGEKDGSVSSRLYQYYIRRAEGGAGLIIVENTAVHPASVNYPCTLEIHHPRFEEGLKRLAAGIKQAGAASAIVVAISAACSGLASTTACVAA